MVNKRTRYYPETCEEYQKLFPDYLRDKLSIELTGWINGHLKRCEACNDKLVDALYDMWVKGEVPKHNIPGSFPPFPTRELFDALRNNIQPPKEVFISYAIEDRGWVLELVSFLKSAGVSLWADFDKADDTGSYTSGIDYRIENCKLFIFIGTRASMKSRKAKHELQSAWNYEKQSVLLLLEDIPHFRNQMEHWQANWQWLDIKNHTQESSMLSIMKILSDAGVKHSFKEAGIHAATNSILNSLVTVISAKMKAALDWLYDVTSLTDQLWTVPEYQKGILARGPNNTYQLGNQVHIVVESDREGHLLLIDRSSGAKEDKIYCLCPSGFAPDDHIHPGLNYLPQEGYDNKSFEISGEPGQEKLLAIISNEPLGFNWMPDNRDIGEKPALLLSQNDITSLTSKLRELEPDSWIALSTYFDVIEKN